MLVAIPDNRTTGDFTIKRYLRYIITTAQWHCQRGQGWSVAYTSVFLGLWHTFRETLRVLTVMLMEGSWGDMGLVIPELVRHSLVQLLRQHTITESDTVQLRFSDKIRRKSACGGIHKPLSSGVFEALVRADIRVYERPP
jgi:hypothetical protein